MKIKPLLLLLSITSLWSCKETKNTANEGAAPSKTILNTVESAKENNSNIESFTLSCGSGCAMTYNEMGRKFSGLKVEIKYKVTQYINEKVEDEYIETYLFESNSHEELTGIYLEGKNENMIESDVYLVRDNLVAIGSKLFKNGYTSKTNDVKQSDEDNQTINDPELKGVESINPTFQGNFSLTLETEETTAGTAYIQYSFNIKRDIATLTTVTYHEPITCNGDYKVIENNKILELHYSGNEKNCKSKEPNFRIKKEGLDYFIKGVGGEGTFNEWIQINKMKQ